MDKQVQQALAQGGTIDITTTGKRSGLARRIEIWFHNVNGRVYITGLPGQRDWYANLIANPDFTFHFKQDVQADLAARATAISDPTQKREILAHILHKLDRSHELATWVVQSPLVAGLGPVTAATAGQSTVCVGSVQDACRSGELRLHLSERLVSRPDA